MANLVKNIQHAKQKQTATQNAAASLSKFFASKHALAVLYSMHWYSDVYVRSKTAFGRHTRDVS
jgi:hypothetical protein